MGPIRVENDDEGGRDADECGEEDEGVLHNGDI